MKLEKKRKTLVPYNKKSYFDHVQIYSSSETAKSVSKTVRILEEEIAKKNKKALEDVRFAETRAVARLKAVKHVGTKVVKYTSRSITYTAQAKKAANSSLQAAMKARTAKTPKDAKKYSNLAKKYAQDSIKAVNLSKKNADLAIRESLTARAAARIPLSKKKD